MSSIRVKMRSSGGKLVAFDVRCCDLDLVRDMRGEARSIRCKLSSIRVQKRSSEAS